MTTRKNRRRLELTGPKWDDNGFTITGVDPAGSPYERSQQGDDAALEAGEAVDTPDDTMPARWPYG